MEDLLVQSGEDPADETHNSELKKQSSAKSVWRTSTIVKLNATVTPKVSGPMGSTRKRMEMNKTLDLSTTSVVKSASTKSSSSWSLNSVSLTRRRNSTEGGGFLEKQPISVTKRQTSVNIVAGKKTSPLASETLRRSLPEVRRCSLPSVATKSLTRSSISETTKSSVKPSSSASSSNRVPSKSLDSTATSTTRNMVSKTSSLSPRTPSVTNGSKGHSSTSSVDRSSGLSGRLKVGTPKSRDSCFIMLLQVEIKAGDDVVSTVVN
ncbi:hypothetical protein CsSME_00043483 [Camellia sinensis var. sinensis]